MSLHENCLWGEEGKPHSCHLGFIVQNPFCFPGRHRRYEQIRIVTCYMLHVTLRPPHFPRLQTLQRIQCKDYPKHVQNVHIALLCAIFLRDKKSWKIFVILFGGIKNSPYLCSRFSGARQFESKFSLCSLVQSLHRQLRPAEQFHRGSKNGHTYDRGEG